MPRTPHRVADLEITAPADPACFHEVRGRLAGWLATAAPGHDELHDDLAVVLSELLANGVAAAPEGSSLHVTARVHDDGVLLEVSNPVAPWVEAARRWDLDDPLRGGGRGLLIVRSLVDDVEVVHDLHAHETTLRCRCELAHH